MSSMEYTSRLDEGHESGDSAGASPEAAAGEDAARGQSEELHKTGGAARIRKLLSYSATDWVVVQAEALEALGLLGTLAEGPRRSLLLALTGEGLADRLFKNLPSGIHKTRTAQMLAVYSVMPEDWLTGRADDLLATGVLDWFVTADDATSALYILSVLPDEVRHAYIYADNGTRYTRLMKAATGEEVEAPDEEKMRAEANEASTVHADGEDASIVDRARTGYDVYQDLKRGSVDLNELQVVTGGDIGGVTVAEPTEEEEDANRVELDFDWKQGRLVADIGALAIKSIQTEAGGVGVKTGPGNLKGFHVECNWATDADPKSRFQGKLAELEVADIELVLADVTILIRSLVLAGLSLMATKPPGSARPTSRAEALALIKRQISDLIGMTLPGMGAGGVELQPGDSLAQRFSENFGVGMDVEVSLAEARVEGVQTSDGDSMESLTVKGLQLTSARQTQLEALEAKRDALVEAGGGGESLAAMNQEIERLRPMVAEMRSLEAKRLEGGLSLQEEDRLIELDNALHAGVVGIKVDTIQSRGVRKGETELDSATVTDLQGEVRGSALNMNRLTRAEQLDEKIADTVPGFEPQRGGGAGSYQDLEADISVGSAEVEGLRGPGVGAESLIASDIKGNVTGADHASTTQANLSVASIEGSKVGTSALSADRAAASGLTMSAGADGGALNVAEVGAVGLSGTAGTVDSASLEGLRVEGQKSSEGGGTPLSASVDKASASGVATTAISADALEANHLHGSFDESTKSASGGASSVMGTNIKAGNVSIDEAAAYEAYGEISAYDDPESRTMAASLGSGDVSGLNVKGKDHSVSVGGAHLGGANVAVSGADPSNRKVDASLASLEANQVDVTKGEHRFQADQVGLSDGRVAVDGNKASVGVGEAELKKASANLDGDKGQVDGLHLAGLQIDHDKDARSASVDVDAVRARKLEAGGVSADELALNHLGTSVSSYDDAEKRKLEASVGSADVSKLRGHVGGVSAQAGAAHVDGASMSMEGTDKAAGRIDNLSGSDVGYRSGDTEMSAGSLDLSAVSGQKDGGTYSAQAGELSGSTLAARHKDAEASLKSGTAHDLSVRGDASGNMVAGVSGAEVSDLRAVKGDQSAASVGSASLKSSRVGVSGVGSDQGARFAGAHSEGLEATDVRAMHTGQKSAATGASAGAAGEAEVEDKQRIALDPLGSSSGEVRAELPVRKPISTTISLVLPVDNGRVDLSRIKVDGSGLIGSVGVGMSSIEVNGNGELVLDLPWPIPNVVLLEASEYQGLISESEGGGEKGSVALQPLIEGIMNPRVDDASGGPMGDAGGRDADGDKKKSSASESLDIGAMEVDLGGLKLGDGQLGTPDAGLKLEAGDDPDANIVELDAKLGEQAAISAEHLRATELRAGEGDLAVTGEMLDIEGLEANIEKPLEEERRMRLQMERLRLGETAVGEPGALDDLLTGGQA